LWIRLADSHEAKAKPNAVRGWIEKQNRLADRDEAKAKLNAVRGWVEKGTLLAELAKYGQDYEKLELVPILTPAGNKQGIQTPVVYEQVCVCVCVCLKKTPVVNDQVCICVGGCQNLKTKTPNPKP
jgi:hypothetical protein